MAQSTYRLAITPYKDVLPRRTGFRRGLVAFLLFVALVLLFLWYIGVFGGNVHVVVPNKVYRSARIMGTTLTNTLDAHRIKTVINLMGGSNSDAWHRDELQACATRNIAHIDIPMSARVLPPPDRLRALLNAFDHAQYPVLFHCNGGADRSGLAGVIYLNLYQNIPLEDALHQQLTWRYGHFSFGTAHAMNDFFALYEQTGNGAPLRQWMLDKYPALYAERTGEKPNAALAAKTARPSKTSMPTPRRPRKKRGACRRWHRLLIFWPILTLTSGKANVCLLCSCQVFMRQRSQAKQS